MALSAAPNGQKRNYQNGGARRARSKTEYRPKKKRERGVKQDRVRVRSRVVQNNGTRYHQAEKKNASFQRVGAGNLPPLLKSKIRPGQNRGRKGQGTQDI